MGEQIHKFSRNVQNVHCMFSRDSMYLTSSNEDGTLQQDKRTTSASILGTL